MILNAIMESLVETPGVYEDEAVIYSDNFLAFVMVFFIVF